MSFSTKWKKKLAIANWVVYHLHFDKTLTFCKLESTHEKKIQNYIVKIYTSHGFLKNNCRRATSNI